MCKVLGMKTIQELKAGDLVDVIFKKKTWDGIEFLVLESIKEC